MPDDITLYDVIVIGSTVDGSFIKGKSDLDLFAIVETDNQLPNGFPMLETEYDLSTDEYIWKDIQKNSGLPLEDKRGMVDFAMCKKSNIQNKVIDNRVYSLTKRN